MCDRLAIKCAISILVPKLRDSNRKVPSVFLSPVGEEATASCLRMRTERDKAWKKPTRRTRQIPWGSRSGANRHLSYVPVSDLRVGRATKGFQRQNPNPEGKRHGAGRAAERKMQFGGWWLT